MKRGGEGVDYIRKTVDKSAIMASLSRLELIAEDWTQMGRDTARGVRIVIDTLESELNLLEGHPTHGWL